MSDITANTPFPLDTCERIGFLMEPTPPESITPAKLPTPWLADSEWLLEELAKAREDAFRLPCSVNNASNINSVVDRLWRLEQNLRYLLHLHREGQRSFVKQAEAAQARKEKTLRKKEKNIVRIRRQFEKEYHDAPAAKALGIKKA